MGKRIERLFGPQLSADSLQGWLQMPVSVVLVGGQAHNGTLVQATARGVVLRGHNAAWHNSRAHTHHFALEEIREVSRTVVAPW